MTNKDQSREAFEHNQRVAATHTLDDALQRQGVYLTWPTITKLVDIVNAARSAPASPVELPERWREQFSRAVYADLAAADNQDVPLEEYPGRILKVLDSILHPLTDELKAAPADVGEPVTSAMPPHQQRVVDERTDLKDKHAKLSAFILDNPLFVTLPEAEQARLQRQETVMGEYIGILDERISAF